MTKTRDPRGKWDEPVLVLHAKGVIDTTPLWDEDGRVYLVNGWAASRCGFNSVLTVRELSADGTLSRAKLRNITATFAQDSDRLILGNTDKAYWWLSEDGNISFTAITQLYDFPFELIPVDTETSVGTIPSHTPAPSSIFTLDGIRLASPQRGINIVRACDGTTKKIVVK